MDRSVGRCREATWSRGKAMIEGGANGADHFAKAWAEERGIPFRTFHANWRMYGRAAGAIRNAQMLAEGKPDLVVAFPGGPGTADMVRRAGINVMEAK